MLWQWGLQVPPPCLQAVPSLHRFSNSHGGGLGHRAGNGGAGGDSSSGTPVLPGATLCASESPRRGPQGPAIPQPCSPPVPARVWWPLRLGSTRGSVWGPRSHCPHRRSWEARGGLRLCVLRATEEGFSASESGSALYDAAPERRSLVQGSVIGGKYCVQPARRFMTWFVCLVLCRLERKSSRSGDDGALCLGGTGVPQRGDVSAGAGPWA